MSETQKFFDLTFNEDRTIALLTLHQHTITIPLVRAIHQVLDQLEATSGPLCLITTCSHPRIFCAGLNFKVFDQAYDDVHNLIAELCRLFARFLELPFPTIAAMNGHTLAGGFMFALSHDLRIMNDDGKYKLGMTEIDLGMTIPSNMMAPLQAKLGPKALREICLFGESLNPQQALKFEVVDRIVKGDQVLPAAFEAAQRMATLATKREAYKGIKVSLYNKFIKQAEEGRRDIYMKIIMAKQKL